MAVGNVLGIVGCTVLADEIGHVLSKDSDLRKVFVVDNEGGRILEKKLTSRGLKVEVLASEDLTGIESQDENSVLIWMNMAISHDNRTRSEP
jgi:hypothetical protein